MKSSYHTETRNHKNHKIGSVWFIFGMVFWFGFKMHRVTLDGLDLHRVALYAAFGDQETK